MPSNNDNNNNDNNNNDGNLLIDWTTQRISMFGSC